jgi:putative SOS response-associated peptidase YedK
MCGRFTLAQSPEVLAEVFGLDDISDAPPRFNIAPSQPVATIIRTADTPKRQFRLMRWGLIPSWAKDPSIGNRLINARAETVAEKPSFRSAFRHRRCLIIADGFYEWKQLKRGKQPYYFHLKHHSPFAFAGLWEEWNEIQTCTILTTAANELLGPVHERMPVILEPENYQQWLEPQNQNVREMQLMLRPYPSDEMTAFPVSTKVNLPANDGAELIEAVVSPKEAAL